MFRGFLCNVECMYVNCALLLLYCSTPQLLLVHFRILQSLMCLSSQHEKEYDVVSWCNQLEKFSQLLENPLFALLFTLLVMWKEKKSTRSHFLIIVVAVLFARLFVFEEFIESQSLKSIDFDWKSFRR